MKYTAVLQELWDAGMEETIPAGNGTAMAQEQQTEVEDAQDGKQYAMRGKEDVSYNALVQKPDMQLTKLIDKIGRRDRKAIVDEGYDNALYNGRVGISGMPAVYVSDIEREVHVSKKSLEHGLDRRTDQLSAATQHVGELLKNAILINMATPKLKTANESYVLLSAGENANGTITPVSFIVNRFTNEVETFDVLKSIKQKKNQPRITAGIGADALLPADSSISIAELINIVKNDFTDLWSNDVIEKLDLQRKQTEITSSIKFSARDKTDAVSVREYLAGMTPKSYMNDTEVELLRRYQTKLKALQEKQRAGLMRLFRHFVHASPAVLPHAPPPRWLIGFSLDPIVHGKNHNMMPCIFAVRPCERKKKREMLAAWRMIA